MKHIPDDLKKYARKYLLIRLCSCVLLLAIFAAVLILFGDSLFVPESPSYRIKEILCIAVVILICFITGVPLKLMDRTFYGIVEKVTVTTGYNSKAAGKRQSILNSRTVSYRGFYSVNTMEISVKTSDGKNITRTVSSAPLSNENNYDELFKQGDHIFHLYGTNVYVKIPNDKKEKVSCSVCGVLNLQDNDSCSNCKHTLVKKAYLNNIAER